MPRINALTDDSSLADTDYFAIDDASTTRKMSALNAKTYFQAGMTPGAPGFTTVGTSGTAQTLTRAANAEDWLITQTANLLLTLAGGAGAGLVSTWNAQVKQNGTGGFTLGMTTTVVWVGGTPTFSTVANSVNHLSFVQYGTGTIYGYYLGSSAT